MKKNLLIAGILCTTAFVNGQNGANQASATPPPPPDLKTPYSKINPIGPRYQWNNNDGYCGETSLISAGLYYGQYVSQFDARALGSPGKGQVKHQLLLGDSNFSVAAAALKLDCRQYATEDSRQFLKWVKKQVVNTCPVIIGVFNNESYFYGKCPNAGDPEYDHIVPVIGWGSARKLDSDDISGDVLLFSDNGLLGDDTTAKPNKSVPYYFPYVIPYFMTSRVTANSPTDTNRKKRDNRIYSLLELPQYQTKKTPKHNNYAAVITGVNDPTHETLPVRLTTGTNYEAPFIIEGSNTRPRPGKVTLTITVSGLTRGQTYNLYHYTDEAQVPAKNFNHQSAAKHITPKIFKAAATTWQEQLTIWSNEKAFFRAVLTSGE